MSIPFPFIVTVGCVWSVTYTVLVTVFPAFPAVSVYVYCNIYVPTTPVFTLPLIIALPLPSTLSVQFAHNSL